MTVNCQIWLCGAVLEDEQQLAEHQALEHPTAVRAREGLARWRRISVEDPGATAPAVERGREPSAKAAHPESSLRVRVKSDASSPGRESAQAGSRPRRLQRMVDVVCPECDGAGVDPHYLISCRRCGGDGSIGREKVFA